MKKAHNIQLEISVDFTRGLIRAISLTKCHPSFLHNVFTRLSVICWLNVELRGEIKLEMILHCNTNMGFKHLINLTDLLRT